MTMRDSAPLWLLTNIVRKRNLKNLNQREIELTA